MSQRKEMGRRKGVTKAGHCHIFLESAINNLLGIREQELAIRDQVVSQQVTGCQAFVCFGFQMINNQELSRLK